MRIISGSHRGKKIEISKKSDIRPTMNKVREAMFNIILHGAFHDKNFEEIKFLDLFCGSGAVGLEAASRGAKSVTMIDVDTSCARINVVNLKEKITVLDRDILKIKDSTEKFDIIFMDPPYCDKNIVKNTLQNLIQYNWMENKCLVMIEKRTKENFSVDNCNFKLINCKKYGASELLILSFCGENINGSNEKRTVGHFSEGIS